MHIHIILCATAILSVTQSTPIAVTHEEVKDESIMDRKIASDVEKGGDFVGVKAPRTMREGWSSDTGGAVGPPPVDYGSSQVGKVLEREYRVKKHSGPYVTSRPGKIEGGYTTTFDSGGCLYGDDIVLLQDGSRKQLKNLHNGDKVYSVDQQGKVVKDEMIMMLHGGPKIEASFYTLTTSSNRTISLTSHHLILKYYPQEKRSQMVAANELKVGDYLLMSDKQQTEAVPITSIEVLKKTGIYTPMTYKGTLLVNDIAVSCYVKHFNKYNELHTLLYPIRLYYYLMKDIFGVSEEPFSAVRTLANDDDDDDEEFYGTSMIRSLHQSKNMIRFVGQELLLGTLMSI